jgi:hypothetical protein
LVGRGLKSYLKSKGIEGLGSVKENRGYLDVAGRGEEADRKLAFAEMRGARGYSGKYEMNQAEKAAVAMDAEGQARAALIGEIAKEKLNIMQVNEYMGWLGFALRKLQAGFGGGADYQSLDAVRRYQAVAP